MKWQNNKESLHQPNYINYKQIPHHTSHSTTFLLWIRIHQAHTLTKKGMQGVEALAEMELKSIYINKKTQFIQPSRILLETTISTHSKTMGVWWYHTVIIVDHLSFKQKNQETQQHKQQKRKSKQFT